MTDDEIMLRAMKAEHEEIGSTRHVYHAWRHHPEVLRNVIGHARCEGTGGPWHYAVFDCMHRTELFNAGWDYLLPEIGTKANCRTCQRERRTE